MLAAISTIAVAYLIGSIPVAWLSGRILRGVDLRAVGSGNAGASNVWQSVSKVLVVPVGLIQIAQGAAAVLVARVAGQGDAVQVLAGIAAVVANDWDPWLGFSGGRGIGQTIGVLLVLSWAALGLFAIVALIGVVARAIPQFIALALVLAPGAALVSGQTAPVVAGCAALAALALLKRLLANEAGAALSGPRPGTWRNRLVFDRDVRDRDAWVRRGLPWS